MQIYADYDKEPSEHFLPLSEDMYQEMYDIELSGFDDDVLFYSSRLVHNDDILELGCGSGRLTRLLACAGHRITGIDLSLPMLHAAKALQPAARFICMDMRALAFKRNFSVIIIPYNTLNLLTDNHDVRCCLQNCYDHLGPHGRLLLQLYVPPENTCQPDSSTTFQFQIFDRPRGGKIVKETLRTNHGNSTSIHMEERYKLRPMNGVEPNRNYRHTLTLNANSRATWLELIRSSGFTIKLASSSYHSTHPDSPNLLLIEAAK